MKRHPDESYEDYRKRLKRNQRELKAKLEGRVFHNAFGYIDKENKKLVRGKGTYTKSEREKKRMENNA
jgi:hypothetical protein